MNQDDQSTSPSTEIKKSPFSFVIFVLEAEWEGSVCGGAPEGRMFCFKDILSSFNHYIWACTLTQVQWPWLAHDDDDDDDADIQR